MTIKSNAPKNYSKKELMKIIEKIDDDRLQSQRKKQNEKPYANIKQKNSSLTLG